MTEMERRGSELVVHVPDGDSDTVVEELNNELENDRELHRIVIRLTGVSGSGLDVIRRIDSAAEQRGLSVDWWV